MSTTYGQFYKKNYRVIIVTTSSMIMRNHQNFHGLLTSLDYGIHEVSYRINHSMIRVGQRKDHRRNLERSPFCCNLFIDSVLNETTIHDPARSECGD